MPTLKQKVAFSNLLKNVEEKKPISAGTIMRSAGYSKSTSLTPKRLTESLGWRELLNRNFPDERLQNLLNKALEKYEREAKIGDTRSFLGLMDMLFKLKDKYPAEKGVYNLERLAKRQELIEP